MSTETNFNGAEIKTQEELYAFAKMAKFPSHGLIIKNSKDNFTKIVKGINNKQQFENTFKEFISNYGQAFVETDMRAMYNPTRMKIIKKAAIKLANKINSLCPSCKTPGFGIIDTKKGLRCELCNFPTRSILSHIYSCHKCNFTKEVEYPNGKLNESPMYCDNCNP